MVGKLSFRCGPSLTHNATVQLCVWSTFSWMNNYFSVLTKAHPVTPSYSHWGRGGIKQNWFTPDFFSTPLPPPNTPNSPDMQTKKLAWRMSNISQITSILCLHSKHITHWFIVRLNEKKRNRLLFFFFNRRCPVLSDQNPWYTFLQVFSEPDT